MLASKSPMLTSNKTLCSRLFSMNACVGSKETSCINVIALPICLLLFQLQKY